jgi:C4-dicarboxylate-specific signal transduction histidine kinase
MKTGQLNIQRIVWGATTIFICLTIWFGVFIYQTTEEEMADQFNSQQITLAQETATGIEEYLGSLKRSLRLVSSINDWLGERNPDFRARLYSSFQHTAVIDIWQINQQGVIDYSLSKLAATYSHTLAEQFWQELSRMKPGEIKISGIFRHEHPPSYTTKAIVLAIKLPPSPSSTAGQQSTSPQALAFVVSLNKIINKFVFPIRSGRTGYAWLLDDNGVLLHHPEHPEMIDRSIFKHGKECYQCHVSFDMERKMVHEKRTGKGRYLTAAREDKLIAYSPINIGQRAWTIAVSAPYTEVTQLVRKSFYQILFFSLVVISGLLAVNVFIFRINKERMQAESRALYADKLEKEVEERTREIKQEKRKLDDIVSAIGAELSVIDQDFRILWANEKVVRRFGSLQVIAASHCYKTYYGRNGICPQCPAIKTFSHGQVEQNELKLNDQGHTRYYQITTTPIRNYTGEVVQVLVLTQDITTQKQQEQILIDSERMSAVGQIAAGLAHDLGNPLTIIAGSAQFCLQNLAPPARVKEYLQVINRNASAANKVIKALLQFARPSGEAVFTPIDLKDLVQKTLLLLKSELAKKEIKIKQDYPAQVPAVLGDKSQLEQVLMNVILNSVEALSQGGEIHIVVEPDPSAHKVHLYIIDNGPGIPEEHLASIFDPFFTTRIRGVGLGLSISKRIMEQHQGKISADNSPQGGTRIKISLPLHQPGVKRRRTR